MGAIAAVGRSYLGIFEFFQPGFENLEFFARFREYGFLHLELFARDEIELVEPALQYAAKPILEVPSDGAQVVGHRIGKLARQLFYRSFTHACLIPQCPGNCQLTNMVQTRNFVRQHGAGA